MNIIEYYMKPHLYNGNDRNMDYEEYLAIHWVGNPNTSAISNINYWEILIPEINSEIIKHGNNESLKYGSAQEVIDLNGDLYLAMRDGKMAYAVGASYKSYTKLGREMCDKYKFPNNCVRSIECCHIDWDGNMTEATRNTLVERCADWCIKNNKDTSRIVNHGEITGKICHKLYMNDVNKWSELMEDINLIIDKKEKKEYNVIEKKQKFDFLGYKFESTILNIDDKINLNSDTLREAGFIVEWDSDNETFIVKLK